LRQNEGEQQLNDLSTSIIEKPLREKKLAGPLNRRPRIKPYENARSTFEYLIGQQRPQSKPAYQSKSSAKSMYLQAQKPA